MSSLACHGRSFHQPSSTTRLRLFRVPSMLLVLFCFRSTLLVRGTGAINRLAPCLRRTLRQQNQERDPGLVGLKTNYLSKPRRSTRSCSKTADTHHETVVVPRAPINL